MCIGSILGSCVGQCVGSCCAQCACSACGQCCENGSKTTRIPYLIIMAISGFASTVVGVYLQTEIKIDFYGFVNKSYQACTDECAGNAVIFRLSFALAMWFAFHALLLFIPGCGMMHNTMWGPRLMLLLAAYIGVFFIENPFFDGYADFARFASAIFLVIQIVFLIIWAYEFYSAIMSHSNDLELEPGSFGWPHYVIVFSLTCLFIFSFTMIGLFYGWYAQEGCPYSPRNHAMLAITIVLILVPILMTACRENCKAQDNLGNPVKIGEGKQGGNLLFVAGIVSAYMVYLLYSGFNADPNTKCNPQAPKSGVTSPKGTFQMYLGIAVTICSLGYLGWSDQMRLTQSADQGDGDEESADALEDDDDSDKKDALKNNKDISARNDEPSVRGVNRDFHLVMFFGSVYLSMLLTNWGVQGEFKEITPLQGEESVWVNFVSLLLTFVLFIWTMVAPCCCPNRKF